MENQVELIAGSYEQIVLGYRVRPADEEWKMEPIFTHHAHTACLSTVAANERFIATGSKDETIQLYDMKTRTEHGALLHHEGTISCLEFCHSAHLLSGGEDGLLCVWSTKTWECLKTMKAHMGHVSSLSVHPSGKLALSVGTDKKLRTWNLIDGRPAFTKNIKQNAHIVKWSPEGDKYIVAINDELFIYNLESASIIGTLIFRKRVSSVTFLTNKLLAVAGDDEHVQIHDLTTEKCICEFKAHENRVKAVESFMINEICVLVTASNDGFIKLWKLNPESQEISLLGQVNTTARITCLSVRRSSSEEEQAPQPSSSQTEKEAVQIPKNKRVRINTEELVVEEYESPKKTNQKKRKSRNRMHNKL